MIEIGEAFRRDSGHQIEFLFGASPVVHKKVADSEKADVLIMQPDFVVEPSKSGKVFSGEHPAIGRVGIGSAQGHLTTCRAGDTVAASKKVVLKSYLLRRRT